MQIADFAIIGKIRPHYNRASSKLYGWYNTGGGSSFINSSQHLDPPIWPTIWIRQSRRLYSTVQSMCALVHLNLLTLFCFLDNDFLTLILLYKPASQSLLVAVDVDTIFSWHWFSCAVMLGAVSLLSRKLLTLMKLSSTLLAFSLPALFLTLFLVSPNSIIILSTKGGKFHQINFSKDIWLY